MDIHFFSYRPLNPTPESFSSNLSDKQQMQEQVEDTKETQLEPDTEHRKMPSILNIFRLLRLNQPRLLLFH